ncbi:MAG: heat-inducible transcriptional repressor HrcA [candidate division Zixibacteria bacterium]
MSFNDLSDRERQILRILTDHYINTAEPVASRAIAKNYDLNLSAASIRNTIKDLEDLGLVRQPHTSAGRIPTIEGYRLYVDYLLHPEELSDLEKEQIKNRISKEYSGIDQLLEQTSRVLGSVSHQLGVAISPKFDSGIITRLELIPVAERRVLVVVAMRSGLARTILLEVETDLGDYSLLETASVLNERLCGLTVGEIRRTLKKRLSETAKGDPRLIRMFIDSSEELLENSPQSEVHIGDTRHILNQPEFKDSSKIRDFIDLVEERKTMIELVSRAGIVEGICVTIGVEGGGSGGDKDLAESKDFSLMSSTYSAGKFKGILGIIGPTRMPYSKLVSVVDYTAKRLSEILSE